MTTMEEELHPDILPSFDVAGKTRISNRLWGNIRETCSPRISDRVDVSGGPLRIARPSSSSFFSSRVRPDTCLVIWLNVLTGITHIKLPGPK